MNPPAWESTELVHRASVLLAFAAVCLAAVALVVFRLQHAPSVGALPPAPQPEQQVVLVGQVLRAR